MNWRKLNELCQLARILGRVSAVVLDGFLYHLILAVELGVFFLFLRNFVMPFIVADQFVQRAMSSRPCLVIDLVCECRAFNYDLGRNYAFTQFSISPAPPFTTIAFDASKT